MQQILQTLQFSFTMHIISNMFTIFNSFISCVKRIYTLVKIGKYKSRIKYEVKYIENNESCIVVNDNIAKLINYIISKNNIKELKEYTSVGDTSKNNSEKSLLLISDTNKLIEIDEDISLYIEELKSFGRELNKITTFNYFIISKTLTQKELLKKMNMYEEKQLDELVKNKRFCINIGTTITYDKVNGAYTTLASETYEFQTNKSFDNIFFTEKEKLLKRLDYFLNHKEDYERKGIPHTLGLLFYGDPGCGKTSCIKVIAKYTGRHLQTVNLNSIKTCQEFQDLFYSNALCKGTSIDKRVIVLEDIDCMSDIIKQRSSDPIDEDEEIESDITLSCILNVIDGLIEQPGRILIITTNHPEKIDDALLRPGRIDMKIHFTKCTEEMAKDIINNMFTSNLEKVKLNAVYSPAELVNKCLLASTLDELNL